MPTFRCQACARDFSVKAETLARYPGWQPKRCFDCKAGASSKPSHEENLPLASVLAKHSAGPLDGVFTDGAAEPNPGPGGWGAAYVAGDKILAQECGHEPHTTNNRMELTALIRGCALVPPGVKATIYTDSQLCVNTCTLWAKKWEAQGWKRNNKGAKGEVKNLDLVKELYEVLKRRPELELKWIRAHSGNKWNEYADALATAYRRGEEVAPFGVGYRTLPGVPRV